MTSKGFSCRLKKSSLLTRLASLPNSRRAASSAASEKSIAKTLCPRSAKARTSYPVPQPGMSTRKEEVLFFSQISRADGTLPAYHGVTPPRKRVSQNSGLELSCAMGLKRENYFLRVTRKD